MNAKAFSDALLLGIVQGITEFLPVSSDGHLVIAQAYLPSFQEKAMTFDVMLHFGTLLAVLFYFWPDIRSLLLDKGGGRNPFPGRTWLWLIIVASIPTGIIGLALEETAEPLFLSPSFAAGALMVNGMILLSTALVGKGHRGPGDLTARDAILIGIMQGFAVLPGISRSSNTIATAFFLGIRGETGARFSFLVSIPAVIGAVAVRAKDLQGVAVPDLAPYALGVAVAFASGLWAIGFLFRAIAGGKFQYFGYYCLFAGGAILLLQKLGI